MNTNDLSKSRIININDFIFRQNLEFYPNLQSITCENNVLTYRVNGTVKDSTTLTFDLRTLPGHVWNYDSNKFMEVIKFNKKCLALSEIADYIKDTTNKERGELAT